MKEDIKMIEDVLKDKDTKFWIGTQGIQAIENLLLKYKELEQNYINPSKARISYFDKGKGIQVVIEGFIPKSKVKEIIQENIINISGFWCIPTDDLRELLED